MSICHMCVLCFQVGDRLLAVNGKLVTDGHEQFSRRIQASPPELRLVVSGYTSVRIEFHYI